MGVFCGKRGKKPIARESDYFVTKVLEPSGRSAPENDGARLFPIQTGGSSELNSECGFGASGRAPFKAKLNIIRCLFNFHTSATLAGAVH